MTQRDTERRHGDLPRVGCLDKIRLEYFLLRLSLLHFQVGNGRRLLQRQYTFNHSFRIASKIFIAWSNAPRQDSRLGESCLSSVRWEKDEHERGYWQDSGAEDLKVGCLKTIQSPCVFGKSSCILEA